MTLRSLIDLLALLACSVYGTIPLFWLVVHPFIERWRKRGRHAYALILPVWGFFIAITFLILWPFRLAHFYEHWFAWAPAAILFLAGFTIYSAAFKSFDRAQVSGLAELEPATPSSGVGDHGNSRACAASDLSRTLVRGLRLVSGDRIGGAICLGRIRHHHRLRDDPNRRSRVGSTLRRELSRLSTNGSSGHSTFHSLEHVWLC